MDKFVTRSSSTPNLDSNPTKRPRDESNEWRYPKRIAIPKRSSADNETSTRNSFSKLPVDQDNEATEPFKKASKKKKSGNVPPIVIELHKDWTHQTIKDLIDRYDKNFHLEYKGNNRVKIQCGTPNGHQAVKSGLLKEDACFHTFTRKDEKLRKVVIKGLPDNLIDCLVAELEILGFPGATATHIKLRKPVQCPPIIVQLPAETDMLKFKQIKYLFNCAIVIERFQSSNKNCTQCYRCQGFGHASRNCNRPARCVKCSLDHITSQCPTKGSIESVRCCNCKQDHPANYSQCKERLKYLERIQTKRESIRNTVISTKAPAKLFSEVAKSVPAIQAPVVPPTEEPKRLEQREMLNPISVHVRSVPTCEEPANIQTDPVTSERHSQKAARACGVGGK